MPLDSGSTAVYNARHRLPPGVGPRANQGNMSGIQVDGLDSLPLGRGKFARFFQVRRKGVGEYEIL